MAREGPARPLFARADAAGIATPEELAAVDAAIAQDVDREAELAEQSPLPDAEVALQNVYATGAVEVEPAPTAVPRRR